MITEAEKYHNYPASWRTRKASGISQSESEVLKIRGADV